jgi:peptidoglycan/LPS O-acetylase OafA/YrhL
MGLLRLLLALAVLLQHSGGIGGYAMVGGPLAVQGFFIISGFYMGLVLNERYDRPALNGVFLINRALRIYVMYALFLAVYLAVCLTAELRGAGSPLGPYLSDGLPWSQKLTLGLLNLSVLGQDLPFWLSTEGGGLHWALGQYGADSAAAKFMVIPVAWSLSLELYFYMLAPFIARRPASQIAALFAASLLARMVAARFGLVADPYSCRFFPFELALFLAGVLSYKAFAAHREVWSRYPARVLALLVPIAALTYPWLLGDWDPNLFFTPPRIGFLALVAVALPTIHAWSQNSTADAKIAELSYPVYLGHLIVLGLVAGLPWFEHDRVLRVLVATGLTLVVAWLSVRLVDSPLAALRRRLTARAQGRIGKVGDRAPSFA